MEIKNFSGLSDDDLISQVKKGKYEYFAEIIKRYCGRLYRIALSYGILDDDCKEVLELTYISAYEKINQFQRNKNFSTWLSGILVTECLSFKSRGVKILEAVRNNNRSRDYFKSENNFVGKVRKVNFEKAIQPLSFKYKSVYLLKELEGMSIKEISEALSISKINVRVRLHFAKLMIKANKTILFPNFK